MRSAVEWAQVRALAADGVSQREIARRLGINRRTVKRLAAADAPPRYERAVAGSMLDRLEPVMRELIEQFEDIKAPRVTEKLRDDYGYQGSVDLVRKRIAQIKPRQQRPRCRFSAKRELPVLDAVRTGVKVSPTHSTRVSKPGESVKQRYARNAMARVFHRLCSREVRLPDEEYFEEQFEAGFSSAERFFARLPAEMCDFRGKSVLDYGCGGGSNCAWAAQQGAARVVGADIQDLELARRKLARDFPDLVDRIEFCQVTDGSELGDERFDIVLSKNTFEHVEDPAAYVAAMRRAVAPGGRLLIGFSPLWKSPWGGHIGFMTLFPWAHLIFPEDVIMEERKRFRPDEDARRFEDIVGGLNRMTLARFLDVMGASGLERQYLVVNAGEQARSRVRVWALRAMKVLGRVPGLREYFAFSVHSVWQRPEAARTRTGRFRPEEQAVASSGSTAA